MSHKSIIQDFAVKEDMDANDATEGSTEDFRFLEISKSPTKEILELLNNNPIGTPGQGMLYQHLGVVDKINSITSPYFVSLSKVDRLVGICCFCKRTLINNDSALQAFYVRYFSLRDQYRIKASVKKTLNRKSKLRNEIESLLRGKGLEINSQKKFLHYAYVDPRNIRSARLCREFGFEKIRQYSTVIFSRLLPKNAKEIEILETSAQDKRILELVSGLYRNFNTFTTENLIGRKYYYVEGKDGQVVAGVQVNPDRWKIWSLPGIRGKLLLNIFSRLSILKRLINRDFSFLTLESIYVAPGCEKVLEKLFETLLVRHKVYSAITLVDAQSQLYNTLKSLDLGLTSKISKEVRGDVICRFNNFTHDEKQAFINNPVYISGIDVT